MNNNAWLIPQNSCSMEQFFVTLGTFQKLNGVQRDKNIQQVLMQELKSRGLYNPYIIKDHFDISSANHKIDEPRFYGAIYETANKKIHVSTYGELLLKYENDVLKRNKVFIGMIYNIQFDNPYKKVKGFNIYPFRLLFNLLREKRLNYYLTNIEVSEIVYYVKDINASKYEKIIDKILEFRKNVKITDIPQFVKNYVSCNYLFNMLVQLGIIIKEKREIERFKVHSSKREKPTIITPVIYKLDKNYYEFVDEYNKEKSLYADIIFPQGLRSDWIREIYNSVSPILLTAIGEEDSMYTQYLQIPKLMLESSKDPNKWSEFEEYITKSFNLFVDINAEKIGGPGQPDCLCHFLEDNTVFCADGKSTHKKLSSINDGRLKQHRNLYNAKYTIVVTPGYVPSAVLDIKGTNTCIITSYCFADLITKYIFKFYKERKDCSYKIFNDLVLNNLGTDLSEKIYKIIDDTLGISKNSV